MKKITLKELVTIVLLFLLVGCFWSTEDDSAGVTGTGNNGVIAVSIKDNTVLQQAKRQALAANELLNITVSLYKESEPTQVVATQTEGQDGRYLFSNVDYDTYAVRVDINQEKGGIEKGIVVNSGETVSVTITINIYITQNITKNITNNFFGLEAVSLDPSNNEYEGALIEKLPNGEYILKTIPGELEEVVLQQGKNKQEIYLSSKQFLSSRGGVGSSEVSSEIKVSSAFLASSEGKSSTVLSSTTSKELNFSLSDLNSRDALISSAPTLRDNNRGGVQTAQIGSYDQAGTDRVLVYFDLPESLNGKTIISASITFNVQKWIDKPLVRSFWKVGAHQMLVSWKEGSGGSGDLGSLGVLNSAEIDGATRNERWFGKDWATPFISIVDDKEVKSELISSVSITPKVDQEFSLNITKVVKAWVEADEDNFGILLRDLDENPSSNSQTHGYPLVYTSEHNSKPPTVTIKYQ